MAGQAITRSEENCVSETAETKVCPLCAEEIRAAAKVCPFCRSPQGRSFVWTHEAGAAVMGIIVLVLAAGVVRLLFHGDDSAEYFTGHREDLVVLGVELSKEENKPRSWVVGVVTNRGEHSWRVEELEVRLMDAEGRLLDVRQPGVDPAFVVLPGRDHGFRVTLGELPFGAGRIVPEVRVRGATDANRRMSFD